MSAVMEQKAKSWSPTIPIKASDNIVSSQFASKKGFVPSYEKETRPCMEQLLTNEYQRIWWQEKETWDRLCTKKIASKNLLQRTVIRRKPPSVPVTIAPKKIKTIRNKKGRKPAETVEDLKRESKKEGESNDVCGQEMGRTEKTEGECTKEAA